MKRRVHFIVFQDFTVQSGFEVGEHCCSSREHNVGVEGFSEVQVAFGDGVDDHPRKRREMLPQHKRIEEGLRASLILAIQMDCLSVWEFKLSRSVLLFDRVQSNRANLLFNIISDSDYS